MTGYFKSYCALTTISLSLKTFMMPTLVEMQKEGYQITVGCAEDETFFESIPPGMRYLKLDLDRGFHLGKTWKTMWRLFRFFRRNSFAAVEYATENVSMPAAISAWMAGVPVRIYDHWGARYAGFSGFSRFASQMIERISALFSTDVRQVSNRNMEMCVADHIYPEKKVKVLGKGGTIGVNLSVFDVMKKPQYRAEIRQQMGIPENAPVFGFVGRIQKDKGVNELLEAFREIWKDCPNSYLLLVGGIDDTNPILTGNMEWARSCANVKFSGLVADVYRYISAFDIMVHPTYREGFGMVLQEAAAMKTPIITTDIIGPGEFITNRKDGLLVKPMDACALEQAMQKMLNAPDERAQFAQKAYENVVENFERSVMIRRIIKDREELIKGDHEK